MLQYDTTSAGMFYSLHGSNRSSQMEMPSLYRLGPKQCRVTVLALFPCPIHPILQDLSISATQQGNQSLVRLLSTIG